MEMEQQLPRTFEEFNEQRKAAFIRVKDFKQAGNRLVGFLCSYTLLEIGDAAGAASAGPSLRCLPLGSHQGVNAWT